MRCNKSKDYLNRELDEQLQPDAIGDLREHLETCSACRDYQDDLVVSKRLLAATEPVLPENFDWKLQLRLNQALQQRAGETAYPWSEPGRDVWYWLRNFGASASIGLAAVMALAVFFGPVRMTMGPEAPNQDLAELAHSASGSDRGPLLLDSRGGSLGGNGIQRPVAAGSRRFAGGSDIPGLELGWSGERMEDLRTIQRLRNDNAQLNRMVFQYQRELEILKEQLDTAGEGALDLETKK